MAIQNLLQPATLQRLSNIEIVAKAVVDGFLTGLHRSPHFGFSLEFAEYRPYTPGDDPRFIDWNVLARADRAYIKRYLGETNTALTILLDTSGSMGFRGEGQALSKFEYARFAAASLAYLSVKQHDAVGLLVFDEEVRDFRKPQFRPGHLQSLLHILDRAEPSAATNLELPFEHFQQFVSRRGMVVMISDFYADPDKIVDAVRPMAFQGQDIVFFHVLDPVERAPKFAETVLLEDMETGDEMEVSGDYAEKTYSRRIREHVETMREAAHGIGADFHVMDTSEPLDESLREYLLFRQRRR